MIEKTLEHRLGGPSLTLPREEFLLEFDNDSTVSSDDLKAETRATTDRERLGQQARKFDAGDLHRRSPDAPGIGCQRVSLIKPMNSPNRETPSLPWLLLPKPQFL